MNAKIWGRWVSRLFQQGRRTRRPLLVQRRLWIETLEDRVTPATINWTGTGVTNIWSNPANWDLGRAPLAGDDLVFGSLAAAANRTSVDNLSGLPVFNSITISASGYIVNGSLNTPKMALSGSINVGSNLGNETISINLQMVPPLASPQQTITVNTGSNLIIAGHLSGNSNAAQAALQTITKAGPGTLELANDNSDFTGAFTIASGGGILIASNPNALGLGAVIAGAPAAGTTTVNSNSQLQLKNLGNPINERLILNGTGVADNGALLNIAGNNTWAGPITLDTDVSIGGNANTSLNITGLLSDTGAGHNLSKEGPGQLILSRTGGNTYRGQTIVDNGVLTIRDPLALGAGADATKPQSGSPQSGTIVNFNSVTGEAGTLQLEYVAGTIPGTDPNAILTDPSKPFNALDNPVVGFQVFNDLLTLNGPGFTNLGALSSLTGKNGWDGDVTIGSPPPSTGSVNIGASTGSELTIGGVISDPNRSPAIMKVLPGRVIFNNANTYRGGTIVAAGALNIRDSQGLGQQVNTLPPSGPVSNVDVRSGASLELEVDSGLDGTSLRTHNRNLGFDSVVGTGPGQEISVGGLSGTFRLSFKGQTTTPLSVNATAGQIQNALNALSTITAGGGSVSVTQVGTIFRVIFNGALGTGNQPLIAATGTNGANVVVSPIYGLTVSNVLQAAGLGADNAGALRSISGINTYTGLIGLGDAASPALGSIGVDRDPRPGHDTPNANYFTFDYSLTITGTITDTLLVIPPPSTLIKEGEGNLILPTANSYTDRTEIREGWITAQNDRSLGTMNPDQPATIRPYTTISEGAALHLKPLTSGAIANLVHDYDLNGSLADNLGGPDITTNGGTLTASGYTFGAGQGPSLSNALADPGTYSISMSFHLDALDGAAGDGWARLLEFQGLQSDFGLYSVGGFLTFYDGGVGASSSTAVITAGTDFNLLFTRNGATKEVVAYINGVEQFRYIDSTDVAVFSGAGNVINFFNDNVAPPFTDEQVSGAVNKILVYDGPLVPAAPELHLINNFIISGDGFSHNYGLLNHAGAIENIAGNNTLSGIIQLNGVAGIGVEELSPPAPGAESQLNLTGYLWDNGSTPGGIAKLGSRRLVIQAAGTYTGDVDIKAGVLLVQNDTALGAKSAPGSVSGPIQGLVHDYELNGSFADAFGGPSLTPNGGSLNPTNYIFGPNQGLTLSGALQNPDNYSIEMVFSINTLAGANGGPWVNLIEFKNRQADTGLYSLSGALAFFDQATGPSGAFSPGVPATLLLTRNAGTKEVVGYVNGVEQFRFIDLADEAVFDSPGNVMNFLLDDILVPNEAAGGTIDRIRIFDRPLIPSQLNPSGNATIVETGAALEIGNSNIDQTQGLMGGLGIWGEHLVLNGQGNAFYGDGALTILSSNSPTKNIVNNPIIATDNAWRGPVSLGSDTTITVEPNSRILLMGGIDDELNPVASGSNLTITGGGVVEMVGANTYRGSTIINQGVLTIDNSQSLGGSGNAEVQTVTVTGATAGVTSFTLTFNGKTTAPISYSGDGPTDAAAIQAALNGLASIGGSANIGGVATVASPDVGVFDVTLGGSFTGFNQTAMTAALVTGPGAIAISEKVAGSGGTEIANGASLQLSGSISVTGEPLLVHGTGSAALPQVPNQWFQVGPESIANGQTPGAQNTTGRITGTLVDPRDPNIIYVATAGGGAWKTIDSGKTWRPIFDAIPEIQIINVSNPAAGTFTLTFDGEDTAPLDSSSSNLAFEIQSALNGLSTISGVGGVVAVTRQGTSYRVVFGGTLIGADVTQIESDNPDVGVSTLQNGKDPRFAMYLSGITMFPLDPRLPVNDPENIARANTLFITTGEPNATSDSFYGTGIYVSTDAGATWTLFRATEVQTVTVTGSTGTFTLSVNGETTSDLDFDASDTDVEDALNALNSINGGASVTRGGTQEVQQITVTPTTGPTFTLDFEGQTTVAIDPASTTLITDIQTALNGLATITAAGGVTVAATANNRAFLIVFGGPGDQPPIAVTPPGLAGVTVTEVTRGSLIYTVTFGGPLAATNVPLMNATGSNGVTANVQMSSPFNPFDGKAVSKIAIDPFTGATYVATGDSVPARNEVQQIRLINWPNGASFTLSFTWPDATGAIVTQTTAAIPINFNNPASVNAARIQAALNDPAVMSTINVLPGNVTAVVNAVSATIFNVTFTRNLGNTNVPTLVANPGYPPANGTGVVMAVVTEGGVSNVNGTQGAAGIWRLDTSFEEQRVVVLGNAGTFTLTFNGVTTAPIAFNATGAVVQAALFPLLFPLGIFPTVTQTGNVYTINFNVQTPLPLMVGAGTGGAAATVTEIASGGEFSWFNMTSVVSAYRGFVATTQAVPGTQGANPTATPTALPPGTGTIPNNPGPDDDYRLQFPQTNVSWTDLALVYTDTSNSPGNVSPGAPVLYAALGTTAGTGDINNAVYWTKTLDSESPSWYVGDPGGSPYSAPPSGPLDPTTPDSRSGGFPRGTFAIPNPGPGLPPVPEIALNGNIKIAALPIAASTGTNLSSSPLYASISAPDGSLRGIVKTTAGGQSWTAVTTPSSLYAVGNFSNAILEVNANTVFIGGQGTNAAGAQTILMTTDGGTTWTDISFDANGQGPHAGVHGFSTDSQGRLLVGTDGGLWRRETNGLWSNLNGDLAISNVNGVASDPTNTTNALAGTQANGIAQFGNALPWTRVDGYGGGRVAIDQTNSLNLYAVSMLTGTNATLRKSIDGGITWNTVLAIGDPTAPLTLDPVNPARVLVGGIILRESLNQGATWTDLQVQISGVRISTVTDVAIANSQGQFVVDPNFLQVIDKGSNAYDPDTIYVTNGTSIYLTKNHGQTWVDRTSTLAGLGSIVDLEVDPRNRDTVYAIRNAFGNSNVFVSTNAGQTWTDITSNLAAISPLGTVPVWKIVIDPRNGFLYVGTDLGVFQSTDDGASWNRFGVGMPNVQVKDLDLNVTTNTLLAGTYGRSVYQLFLDTPETSTVPVTGVVTALGGSSVWTGNVIIDGDPNTNEVNIGAFGVQNLPNGIPVASLNFVGPISDLSVDRPGATINKFGQGNVIFTGTNLYDGETFVEEGALVVDNAQALGGTTNGTTVVDGATIQLRSNLDAEPIELNGNGISFNDHFTGSLRNIAGNNTYTGPLTLATNATVGVDSGTQLTIGSSPQLIGIGTINGDADLTKELPGTLVLGGSNDTFTGAVQVNQGVLRLENSNAVGATPGVLVLDGAQVQLNTPAGGPPVAVDAPLALSGSGIFGEGALLNVGGDNAWNGDITFEALPGFSFDTFPAGAVAIGTRNASDTLTIGGAIGESSPVGLNKVGAGRVSLLSPDNSYTGATEVLSGTLDIRDPGALGQRSGTQSIQRVVTLSAERTGTFRLGFNGDLTGNLAWGATANAVRNALNALSTINGLGSVTVDRIEVQTRTQNGPQPLDGGNNGFGYVYTITFGGGLANTVIPVTATGNGGTGAAASVVATGGVDVRVTDGATLELTSPGAGFTVNGHLLTLNGAGVNGAGALLNVAGDNTWSGPVELPVNVSVGAAAGSSITLDGGVAGAGSDLTKVGAGTLNFPTAGNTQDSTIITDGTVDVDGAISAVVLNGGTLAGIGQVGDITSNGNGGFVSPGDSGDPTGTLSSTGGVLDPSDTFFVDLVDAATSDNDRLDITSPTGIINLGGAVLDGTTSLSIQVGDSFTILQTARLNGVVGHFAGFDTAPVVGGSSATIAYIGGVKYVVDYFSDHVAVTRELANVAITLTPSIPAPVYGQPETFTATLTPEPGAPPASGVVTFTLDGVLFVRSIVNGVATFDATTTGPLSVANHTISVDYDGHDAANQVVFNPASAGPLTVVVAPAGTTTALTASVTSPIYGQSILLTATVTSLVPVGSQAPNTLVPQGTVSFFRDNGTLMGTGTLGASGVATFDTATLATPIVVGSHNFQAVYNSDGVPDNYNGSTSSNVTRFISKASTGTSVVTSGSPTVFGQPVTFTATVTPLAPGSGNPTGTVTFRANGALVGTGTVNSSGIATYTTVGGQLAAGATYNVVASYSGDSNFNSSAGTASQTVIKANSTTTVASSSNPAVFGEPVSFTATVTGVAPGGGFGSGVVTFKRDGTVIGTALLNVNGQATYTTTFGQLPLGSGFVITAEFAGDNNLNASTGSTTQDVISSATTTTVGSTANPAVYGQPVTFSATVTPVAPGSGFPSGTVTFTLGAVTLGTAPLDANGIASYTTTLGQLPVGAGQVITATYSGNAGFTASSGTISETVNKDSTTNTITASANPSGVEQSVTFTATIAAAAPGGGDPTGTVTFLLNGNFLGTGTLSTIGGVTAATFTAGPNTLPQGLLTITADYSGDTNFLASSNAIDHTVLLGTTTTVGSSVNPSFFGQSVTFTATVAPVSPGTMPTGSVTFLVDGVAIGNPVALTNGIASFSTSSLVTGSHVITATYSGDGNYANSTGTKTQTVNGTHTATTISTAPVKGVAQRAITFTIHVGAVAPGAGIPSGQVIIMDGTKSLGTVTLDAAGNAVFTHHLGSPLGKHAIHANYQGAADFETSNGSTTVKIVANGTRTSTVTLKTSAAPSNVGVPITFTATVRDTGAAPAANPGGTVMFVNTLVLDSNGKPVVLGYGKLTPVSPGVMRTTFTTSFSAIGEYDIQARYSGNGLFAKSRSQVVPEIIKVAPTRTSSADLTQSSGTSAFGQTVSFVVTVSDTGSIGTITPTGTVTFTDSTTNAVLGTVNLATLSAGVAKAAFTTALLNVGSHDIVATYNGDTDFAPNSASNAVSHTITKASSSLTLTSNAAPARFGQLVTFKATVISGTPSGVPTGTVLFFSDGVKIGEGTLTDGVATFKTSTLTIGTHAISASYAGDGNFTGSAGSLAGGQVVSKSATTANLTRSTTDAGQPFTFTATILPIAPGGGLPTGSVTFMIDGIDRGTVGTTNGIAQLFLPNGLSQGSHTIVVKYLGDANFNASNTNFTFNFGGRTS